MGGLAAIVFDMDGTLVRYSGAKFESSWGALAAAAGVHEASLALFEEFFPRRDAYAEWVARDAALLEGVEVDTVDRQLFPAPYAAGVRSAVDRLKGRFVLGILSSGVDRVANRVKEDLGLDFARANHLEVVSGRFTGRSETRVELWEKEKAFERVLDEHRLDASQVCYVGDHVNDLPVMREAALAIAANPKDDRVRDAADHVIEDFSDLPGLVAAFDAAQSGGA